MNPQSIDTVKVGNRIVLTPQESLTHQNCKSLEATLSECISQKKAEIILDLKGVLFLDSEALELLLRTHEELGKQGGLLKIVGINAVCRDILLATRLINVCRVDEHIPEAIRSGVSSWIL